MLVIIIALFVITNVIIILSTMFSYNNFQKCKNFQNTNCPAILCNGDPSNNDGVPTDNGLEAKDGSYPALCWPFAYRPVGDPTNPDTYQCSWPLSQALPSIG